MLLNIGRAAKRLLVRGELLEHLQPLGVHLRVSVTNTCPHVPAPPHPCPGTCERHTRRWGLLPRHGPPG